MAGTWPNMDLDDMETLVRFLIAEDTPRYFTQAEIWRWLAQAAGRAAESAQCVRRILDAVTTPDERVVAVNAARCHYCEYVPAEGRPIMLPRIDPRRVGHSATPGYAPQSWFPYAGYVTIEPIPNAVYQLRLYVSDGPRIRHAVYPIADFSSGWTETGGGALWTPGDYLQFTGPAEGTESAIEGVTLEADTDYVIIFTVTDLADAQVTCKIGAEAATAITTANGIHAVAITAPAGSPPLTFLARDLKTGGGGTLKIDDIFCLRTAAFSAGTDQTDIPPAYRLIMVLWATAQALYKDKRRQPAMILERICDAELDYLRRHQEETIPDGEDDLKEHEKR